jgi:hypothetical protein
LGQGFAQSWALVSAVIFYFPVQYNYWRRIVRRIKLKCDGTLWRKGEEVRGKPANRTSSQYSSHYLGKWCIQHYYRWCAHTSSASSLLNWRPSRFKWTRPFRGNTKSGLCACAITFQTKSTFRETESRRTRIHLTFWHRSFTFKF